eukprot:TRINITY_DN15996_c0_g1_i3.p1 TRINITY_DN15996_c0_g1~~TRINITY_DN15996_c0_g1_i3.p1  ORF type:complete len:361 (+),score=103.33 TRINITY_DN15996_c0_g1_i3:65-1147(+)
MRWPVALRVCAVLQIAATVAARECRILEDMKVYGHNIRNTGKATASAEACRERCSSTADCAAAVWSPRTQFPYLARSCWLKRAPVRIVRYSGSNVSTIQCVEMRTASTDSGKWVVTLTVNRGYVDFFWNWLHSYQLLRLTAPVVVFTEDDAAYKLLTPPPDGVRVVRGGAGEDPAHSFGSSGFNTLVSKRASRMLRVVKEHMKEDRGILYTDVDTVWVQDPFPYLVDGYDMIAQMDTEVHWGMSPYYCTCFLALWPTEQSLRLLTEWDKRLSAKQEPGPNQYVFNQVVQSMKSLKHKPLPTDRFPSGARYFNRRHETNPNVTFPYYNRNRAVVVHNNWVQGKAAKVKRFQQHKLWSVGDG